MKPDKNPLITPRNWQIIYYFRPNIWYALSFKNGNSSGFVYLLIEIKYKTISDHWQLEQALCCTGDDACRQYSPGTRYRQTLCPPAPQGCMGWREPPFPWPPGWRRSRQVQAWLWTLGGSVRRKRPTKG